IFTFYKPVVLSKVEVFTGIFKNEASRRRLLPVVFRQVDERDNVINQSKIPVEKYTTGNLSKDYTITIVIQCALKTLNKEDTYVDTITFSKLVNSVDPFLGFSSIRVFNSLGIEEDFKNKNVFKLNSGSYFAGNSGDLFDKNGDTMTIFTGALNSVVS